MTVYEDKNDEFLFCRLHHRWRDRKEIIHDILVVAKGGLMQNRVMFGANLAYLPLKKALKQAEVAGLIEEIEAEERYWINKPTLIWKTTEKGLKYAKSVYENSMVLEEIEI